MAKTLRLSFIVLLISWTIKAQKNITKEEFNNYVNYASCKYVESFIDQYDKNKIAYFESYQKKLKIELQKVTLDNQSTIIKYEDLKDFLDNNNPALVLVEKINQRKKGYKDSTSDTELIKSLSTSGWKGIDLSKVAVEIQNAIFDKINKENKGVEKIKISETDVIKTQTIQTSGQVDEHESKLANLNSEVSQLKLDTNVNEVLESLNDFKFLVYVVFGILLIIVVILVLLLFKRTSRDSIIEKVINSEIINNQIKKLIKQKSDTTNQKSAREHIEERILINKQWSKSEIISLIEQVIQYNEITQNRNANNKTINKNKEEKESNSAAKTTITKYLKGKSGRSFSRADNDPDNSFFGMVNESNGSAEFVFYGNSEEAIAKRVFSDDISEIVEGSYNNTTSVITVSPGTIHKNNNSGNWEVSSKIKIKLI